MLGSALTPESKQWREPRVIRSTGKIRPTHFPQSILQHMVTMDQLFNTPFYCWIFTGRTDAEAEIPILWPPDLKS